MTSPFDWKEGKAEISWTVQDRREKSATQRSRQIDAQRAEGIEPLSTKMMNRKNGTKIQLNPKKMVPR